MVASRTILESDSDFYVSQSGDDSNSGATAATAKKTPQAMMNTLFREYDHGGVRVQVNCSPSLTQYPGFSTRGAWVGHYGQPLIGGSTPTFEIRGVTNDPEAVTIDGIQTVVGKSLHMDWITITGSSGNVSGGMAVHAQFTGSEMVIHNCIIGNCNIGLYAQGKGALIFMTNALIWNGSCQELIYADAGEVTIADGIVARGACSAGDFVLGAANCGVVKAPLSATFTIESGGSVGGWGQRAAVARGGQVNLGAGNVARNADSIIFPSSSLSASSSRIGGGFIG